jgi:hypothetical protein
MQKEFWQKLLNRKMSLRALNDLTQSIRLLASGSGCLNSNKHLFQNRMAISWNHFNGKILLILSASDLIAKEFRELAQNDLAWRGALAQVNLQCRNLNGVDHTFSCAASRKLAENSTIEWLEHTYGKNETVVLQC